MQTNNCSIMTIAEALRAAGLQNVVRTLIVASVRQESARGVFGSVGKLFALLMRKLGLLPALAPVCPAMPHDGHQRLDYFKPWQTGRLERSTSYRSTTSSITSCPGIVSIG